MLYIIRLAPNVFLNDLFCIISVIYQKSTRQTCLTWHTI